MNPAVFLIILVVVCFDWASGAKCPISWTDSLDLLDAITNFRSNNNLPAILASRTLTATACVHQRDVLSHPNAINFDCGINSWSTCCYPVDHSNPTCMERKPLQVSMQLGWESFNVASSEIAYEFTAETGFRAVRALDSFAADDKQYAILMRKDWKSIGIAVGDSVAYVWFSVLSDPNVGGITSAEDAPGCSCQSTPSVTDTATWQEDSQFDVNAFV